MSGLVSCVESAAIEARPARRLRKVVEVRADPESVFSYLDDVRNTGAHMQRGGMGGNLEFETLSENATGVGASHRWHGKVMGFRVDFTTLVTHWVKDREKAYHTVGEPRMVIMSEFEIRWALDPTELGTRISIDFGYQPPQPWVGRLIGTILGRRYGEWCLNMIMADATAALGPVLTPVG